jgi:serine/threonine-protein kinase RsbW
VESDLSVASTLESKIESVDIAEEMIHRYCRDAGFSEEDQYFVGLAAHEILVNAIKHGNRFDPRKKVGFRLARDPGRLTIEVTDEGDGFRLDEVPDPHAGENRHRDSGRGLAIALAIMDEFSVDRNQPHGTRIRMVKLLKSSSPGTT